MLFGEWALVREWGRLGNDGGQSDIALNFNSCNSASESLFVWCGVQFQQGSFDNPFLIVGCWF